MALPKQYNKINTKLAKQISIYLGLIVYIFFAKIKMEHFIKIIKIFKQRLLENKYVLFVW